MSATPFSYRQYAGNGSTTTFSVPFPYLLKAHVKVYLGFNILDGTFSSELVDGVGFNWTSGTQIQATSAPASGQTLTVIRQTPNTTRLVDWQDGSNLISSDLDTADLQNLYVVQEQQDRNDAAAAAALAAKASGDAATAALASTTATANSALAAANSASTNASTALTQSNTALSQSSTALSQSSTALAQSSTALTNSAAAVTAATAASADAATSLTQSAAAVTTANSSQSTANTAATNASTALSQSNTALSQSATALSQSSTALSNSSAAVSTANTANSNAAAALNAVAASVQYQLVANVAAIPASPADGDAVEVANSTGIESFTPLANKPAGFVGDTGLSVRMQYSSSGSTWNWLNYFANDSDTRYLKKSGGTLTGALTLNADPTTNLQAATKQYVDTVANAGGLPLTGGTMTGQILGDNSTSPTTPGYAFDGDANTGLYTTGADELALATGGSARLTIDAAGNVAVPGTLSQGGNNVLTTSSLSTSTSSTSTTTAATSSAVKSAYDLADTANTTATTANTTANAALPKAGGAMTGDLTLNAQSDLRFADSGSSNWVAFQAPATVSSNVTWTLPSADGTASQVLSTNGSGTLSWTTPAGGGASVTTSDTAPSTPSDGDLWYDSVGGRTYVYYDDGDTSQWVDAAPQGGSGSTGTKIEVGNTKAEVTDTGSDGAFVVTTEGSERLRVDSSGNVGIGGTPTRPLTVAVTGSTNILGVFDARSADSATVSNCVIAFSDPNSTAGQFSTRLGSVGDGLSFYTNGANERMKITSTGLLYCPGVYGSTTGVGANVVVQSDGKIERSTSSAKYKTNVETLEDKYADALLGCRPVWYRSLCASDNPNHGFWGFIAEEVAEIDPRLVFWKTSEVSKDEDGNNVVTQLKTPEPEGVQYDRFVPHLLNLIKRQHERIETLEAANADLAARITALEAN